MDANSEFYTYLLTHCCFGFCDKVQLWYCITSAVDSIKCVCVSESGSCSVCIQQCSVWWGWLARHPNAVSEH